MGDKELVIIDDIMAPVDTIVIRYEGKNPFAAMAMVEGIVRHVMKLPGKDFFETDVKWDTTGENREFYGRFVGKRKEDRWTETRVRVVIQGSQHAKEKTGWARIELKGFITTKYEYSNFLQRAFWWFYNHTFYNQHRRDYLDFGKENVYEIKERYQRALGILPPGET